MSKYVHIDVSTLVSTDFYIEVPDNATNPEIIELAKKEITLPIHYPHYIDDFLRKRGIIVQGIDSMLKSWISDELKYLIDGENYEISKSEI